MKHHSHFACIILTFMLLSISKICCGQTSSDTPNLSNASDTTALNDNLEEVVVVSNHKGKETRATAPLQILTGKVGMVFH